MEGYRVYLGNEKIRKLWEEIKPWMKGASIQPDAPEEIKAKFAEIGKLMDEEEERQISML